jgi:hypothetical protein
MAVKSLIQDQAATVTARDARPTLDMPLLNWKIASDVERTHPAGDRSALVGVATILREPSLLYFHRERFAAIGAYHKRAVFASIKGICRHYDPFAGNRRAGTPRATP